MTTERTTLAEGQHLRLIREGHWEYADRAKASGAVVIVAITDDRQLILVEQYRIPVGRRVVELPAGLVGDVEGAENEQLEEAARRELLEETGYEASELKLLTVGPPTAGLASEIVAFILATGIKRVSTGGGIEHEQIEVHCVPLDGAAAWLAGRGGSEVYIDPKVYAGLYFALTSIGQA
jgi:ADP-ribose pyrophosphatase